MSFINQPPLTPGIGNYSGLYGANHAQTKNPFYSVGNQFLPRNLHDVIRWVRFITINSPVTTEVLRKLATYPITAFEFQSADPAVKSKYKTIEKSFRLKSVLHDIGFQYYTIGNVFVSIHFPIVRTYSCPNCKLVTSAKDATFLKFREYKMSGKCPNCGNNSVHIRHDAKSLNIQDMNVIIWDPINISVNNNPITGKSEYYYTIPNEIKRKIQQGDKFLLDTIPWEFVEAIKENKQFLFGEDRIYHLKNLDMGFSVSGVSIPPLVSHFGLVFYQATLRKANESIATDYMAPMRVVYPAPQTGNSDPVVTISMRNFASKMEEAFMKHKQDNNHIVIAPVPIGYQAVSGEGKTLLVTQEIAQAEESLLLSMGVSRELLSGSTNWTSSTVGLRMLRNTLDSYVGQIEELLDWIFLKTSTYLGISYSPVTLTPFQLTDDEFVKNMAASLTQAGGMSMTTLYSAMGKNYDDELELMLEEAKTKARHDIRVQYEVELAQYMEGLEINKIADKDTSYTEALKKCQDLASQLINAGPDTTREVLNELKVTNYADYLMTAKLLEEMRTAQTAGTNMELAGEATDPNSPNSPDSGQGVSSQPGPPGQGQGPGPAGPSGPGSQGPRSL